MYQGFLDQYTITDIGAYVFASSGQSLSMIDVSIKVGMDMRRSNCGNYEKEAGFPKRQRVCSGQAGAALRNYLHQKHWVM